MSLAPLPPGPRGHFLLGSLPEYRRGALGFLEQCAREYGDYVSFRLGPRRHILVNDPVAMEQVLVTNHRNFRKTFLLRQVRLLLGNGLIANEGDSWLRQRRLAQPAFHRSRMAGHGDVMVALAKQMLGSWRGGETRDLHREMMQLTLEIAAKTLFDADVAGEADEMGRAIGDLMRTFEGWLSGVLPPLVWLPTPGNLRLRRMVQRLDAIIYRIIEERKATAEDRGDLLSMLLAARDEDGRRMTDQQVRDEAMTLLLAGQETTAQMLSWTWYLLSQHAEVEAKLFAEWSSVLEGRAPTMADLPRLAYTEKVVSESLRLYPPAYRFGREALGDCELGGYRVPAGTTVLFSQWLLHRDARYYDCPEKFNPDRWATGLRQKLPKFSYCPFGGGPRGCIGQSFAMMEAVLLLATIGQRFRFRLAPSQLVTAWPSFTLRPKEGIRMVLTERKQIAPKRRNAAGHLAVARG